jgi:hypothetical protein
MQMMDGMRMANPNACTATPTQAQQAATVTMVNTSWNDAKKYQSLAVAKAAGYVPITPSGDSVVHYLNPAYYQSVVKGGPVLNYQERQTGRCWSRRCTSPRTTVPPPSPAAA